MIGGLKKDFRKVFGQKKAESKEAHIGCELKAQYICWNAVGEDNDESLEKKVAAQTDFLLDRMAPDFGLIDKLFARQILTRAELHSIKLSSNTTEIRNKMILDFATTKGKARELIETLEESGQIHLVNFLIANGVYNPEFGEDWPLPESTLLRLQVNRESLIELLDTSDLCAKLFSASTINRRQMEFILSRQTDSEKNESLLDIMSQFSIRQYNKTISCLHSSNQSHLEEVFSKDGAVVRFHANLEGAIGNVDTAENEIVTSIMNLLSDKTMAEANHLLRLTQLGLFAVRKGESIVFYFHIMTSDDLLHLNKLLCNGKLKENIVNTINHMLCSANAIEVTLTRSQEELVNCLNYFGKDPLNKNEMIRTEEEPFKTNMQDLPKEILDEILLKVINAMVSKTDYTIWSLNHFIYGIVTQMQTVSSEWNNRLTANWMEIQLRRFRDKLVKIGYRSNPVLIETIRTKSAEEESNWISGLTILDKELFIISGQRSVVEVYDSNEFSFRRQFHLKELNNPWDIDSCSRNKCIYLMDHYFWMSNNVLRVDSNGRLLNGWSTGGDWHRLSVTYESNVILIDKYGNSLIEYSPDGKYIRKIDLSSGDHLVYPRHAIKLTDGNFVVSDGNMGFSLNRVYLVDVDGKVEKSFSGNRGMRQLYHPIFLAIDGNGLILVSDRENRRVFLLDSNLEFKREIVSREKHGLQCPERICLDEANGRLFVVDNEWNEKKSIRMNGRVLVYVVK